jgi:amino acid transporter
MTAGAPAGLIRVMGRWDLVALTIDSIIGSGIFFLPATIAGLLGPFSPYAYLICALVTLTFILSFAEVSSRFETGGGPYRYAHDAFGKFAGFQVGWIVYLTRLAGTAANLGLFVAYLGYFLPGVGSEPARVTVLLLVTAVLAFINILGVRQGAFAVDIITIAKVLPLVVVIVPGLFLIEGKHFAPGILPPYDNVMRAVFLLTFAFGGFEIMTIPSGEAINPRSNVPRALITGMLIVASLYFFTQLVATGVMEDLSTAERPLAELASVVLGPLGGSVIAIGAVISTLGLVTGNILGAPRLTHALGENRQLPAFFSHVHPAFRTPDVSICVYAGIIFLLAAFSNFITLAAISVVSRLLFYISTCASVLVFRRRDRAPFTLPFGSAIPVLGILLACYLLRYTKIGELYFTIGGIIVGTVLYALTRRSRA